MSPTAPRHRNEGAVYRLTVSGRVGEGWREWFGADALHPGKAATEIVLRVADQAELLGRLRRAQDLDLQIIELALVRPSPCEESDAEGSVTTDTTDTQTPGEAS